MSSQAPIPYSDADQHHKSAVEGMWVFLATEALLFGALFTVYVSQRLTWTDAFAEASGHTHIVLGTLNTVLLMTSSLTIAIAVYRHRQGKRLLPWLWATIGLGLAFLAIKAYEYTREYHEGLVPFLNFADEKYETGVEVFFGFYFLATGLHALHMLIGIGVVGVLSWQLWRRGAVRISRLEVSALYWHLVDVVWVFLFPLLYLVGRHGGSL